MNNNKYRLYKAACGVFRVKSAYIKMAAGVPAGSGKGVGNPGTVTKAVTGFADDVRGMLPGQKSKKVYSFSPSNDKRLIPTPYIGAGAEQLSSGNFGKVKAPAMSRTATGGSVANPEEYWSSIEKQVLSDDLIPQQKPIRSTYTAPDLNEPKPVRNWNSISDELDYEIKSAEHWDNVLRGIDTEAVKIPPVVTDTKEILGYGQRMYDRMRRPTSFVWNGIKKHPVRTGLAGATVAEILAESQDRGLNYFLRPRPSHDTQKERITPVYDPGAAWRARYTGKPTDADRTVPAIIDGKQVDVFILGGEPFIELPDGSLASAQAGSNMIPPKKDSIKTDNGKQIYVFDGQSFVRDSRGNLIPYKP